MTELIQGNKAKFKSQFRTILHDDPVTDKDLEDLENLKNKRNV